MAPEIIEGKPYKGNTTDIFALGVVLFVMTTGVMPFSEKAAKTDTLYQHIAKGDEKKYWECINNTYKGVEGFSSNISDEFKQFIWQFFHYHYFERINLDKIRSSKWIAGTVPSKDDIIKEMLQRKNKLANKEENSKN
jgi:hypothetical protein